MQRGFDRALPLALLVFAWTVPARSTEKQQCIASYEQAQKQRHDGQYLGARQQLLTCTDPACPAFIASDCARWLIELDASTPTIVISARDLGGRDILLGQLTIDGVPV